MGLRNDNYMSINYIPPQTVSSLSNHISTAASQALFQGAAERSRHLLRHHRYRGWQGEESQHRL